MNLLSSPLLPAATAIGCACVGGVLFAFSGFIMPALARLEPSAAVSAMQSVNVTAVRPPLMIALFGTAALCVVSVWRAVTSIDSRTTPWLLAGSLLYLVGVIGTTAIVNVPMNDRLAALTPSSAEAATYWTTYLSSWTAWNHVRAAAGLAAAAAFLVARWR